MVKHLKEAISKMCDNTDCKTRGAKPIPIRLKEEFNFDYCMWCRFCIHRDGDMVLAKLHE